MKKSLEKFGRANARVSSAALVGIGAVCCDSVRQQSQGKYYEFFAGGGMARAGLGQEWTCLFANDIDPKKGASYAANWGDDVLRIEDIGKLTARDLPGQVDLAWASFPCQDLSLAGSGAGLKGDRSGNFWPFCHLLQALADEGRMPPLVVLENVCGALTSHNGRDFAAIGRALTKTGYQFGALVINAVHFVPQSRPRLFIVCAKAELTLPPALVLSEPDPVWRTRALVNAHQKLPPEVQGNWIWWRLPVPPDRQGGLFDLIEHQPQGVTWNTQAETDYLMSLMSPVNLQKVEAAQKTGRPMVGTIYRRTRRDETGRRVQRAEIRFDEVAGCLRTPMGGSSRQSIMLVDGQRVRSRLLSPRETARLMGLPDSYQLPDAYNQAYHLTGDGLVVPVVRFLAENILDPLLVAIRAQSRRQGD
ncbi:MAG: DNA cytosine methyltransferase [Leptolyngbyaceae cyanobacterium MO_188.B28]|nr:DNA cytosine methyltransferase [Leptolyngbyaceae cyanobacterium MO_188.B28]